VLWFPQKTPHTEWADPDDPVRSTFLSVRWQELPRPPALRITDTEGRIGQLAHWLYAERERDPSPDRLIATALTQALVGTLSKFHFIRRYRTLTGRTPMEDLRLIRIEAARDLLLTTNLPLKEIAPRCGLGDEYHLSRLFRRYQDVTPSELRHRRQ